MSEWKRKRFAFNRKINAVDLYTKTIKKTENVFSEANEGEAKSYFLPNGNILHCFEQGKKILSKEFGTPRDWKLRDMGEVPDRIASSLIEMSKMSLDWRYTSFKSENIFITTFVVENPMQVVIVEIEYKNSQDIDFGLVEIPEQIDMFSYFNRRIAFAGASSSGKTETARTLTSKLNIDFGANAEHATEYARSFILRYGVPDWKLQPFLEQGQGRRESDISGHNIVVSDGPRFLNTIYTRHYFSDTLDKQNIYILHKIYKKSIQALTEYTDIVYCERQKIKQDGCRFQNEDDNEVIDAQIFALLKDHNVDFIVHNVKQDSLESLIKKIFYLN